MLNRDPPFSWVVHKFQKLLLPALGERLHAQKGMGFAAHAFFVPSIAQRDERVDEMLHVACKRISRWKRSRLLDAHAIAIARRFFEIVPACIVRRNRPRDRVKARCYSGLFFHRLFVVIHDNYGSIRLLIIVFEPVLSDKGMVFPEMREYHIREVIDPFSDTFHVGFVLFA